MSIAEDVATRGIGWDDAFVDAKTAAAMRRELRYVHWQESRVVKPDATGGHVVVESERRVSSSAAQSWFNDSLSRAVASLEARICATFSVDSACLESWQAVRYEPGGKFEIHHDGGSFGAELAGERVLTFLLYLQTPASGGETYFPELGLLVPAVAGKLVVWNNLLPDGSLDRRFLHAATPVHEGRKTILTTWSRQRPLR